MRIAAAVCSFVIACAVAHPVNASSSPDRAFFHGVASTALANGVAPGIALAVVRDGRIVYEAGFGKADVAAHRPVTAETPFAVGSVSKQLTAAAIMLLVRAHKIALDDALAKYVPILPNAKQITLRMLLNQTSGLHNYPLLSEHAWPLHGPIALSKIIAILATDKPDFVPGTKWEYSNANYAVLAAVAEKVSGMPFGDFLRERVFAPLQMNDSGYGYAAQQTGRVAVGYVGATPETPPLSLDLGSGAGAVVSSAHDLALWDISLMGATLLSKTEIARMWRPGQLRDGSVTDYAMGWVPANVAGHREVWHNGLAPGAGGYCYNAIFPADNLAVAVLTNGFGAAGSPERMVQQIAAAYGIGTPPAAATVPTPAPGADPTIDALARALWDELTSGKLDRSTLSPQFSAVLTPTLLAQTQQGIMTLGTLRSFTFIGKSEGNGLTIYRYSLTFASGAEREWAVAIAPDGKIAGSRLLR
jgi:D-alanyl-D-alanine carboxypeptidase